MYLRVKKTKMFIIVNSLNIKYVAMSNITTNILHLLSIIFEQTVSINSRISCPQYYILHNIS